VQQEPFAEFFEDLNAALVEAVRQLGGAKKMGATMRPELPIDQAADWVRACLNRERREKFSPEQLMLILRLAREAGYHGAMSFVAFSAGYTAQPAEPEDQAAELQREFISAVDRLERLQKQLQRVQRVRSAA